MRKRRKKLQQIDLQPHEWRVITEKPAREPFFGQIGACYPTR